MRFAGSIDQVIVYSVYRSTLIILATVSTLYHALDLSEELTNLMQRLDRMAIALLIAGTATPLGALNLSRPQAVIYLSILWGLSGLLILSHFSLPALPTGVYVTIYLTMGWLGLYRAEAFVDELTVGGLIWLLVGGV